MFYMTENEKLKFLQKELKFSSQTQFAEKLGIKQGSLSDIYRGKEGVGVSNSIKMKLNKEYSINFNWWKSDEEPMIMSTQNNKNSDSCNNQNNNINGNTGNIAISHSDITKLIELQKGYQEMHSELNERLKTSQNQVNILLEILKNSKK